MNLIVYLIPLFCFAFQTINGYTCEPGWVNREEKCYKIFFPSKSTIPPELAKFCQSAGAHPVHVSTIEENDFIRDLARKEVMAIGKYPAIPWVLTGGFKTAGEKWHWNTLDAQCPVEFSNWGPNEPVGIGGDVFYIYLDDKNSPYSTWGNVFFGKWNDFANSFVSDYPVMCEKSAKGAPINAASCTYKKMDPEPTCEQKKEDGCIQIKKSTLLTILESCSCSAK